MTKSQSQKNFPIGADTILEADFTQEPPVLSKGILPAGGGMIIAGDTNVGKSLVRTEWTLLLALGLPIYDMETSEPQRILIFQAENPLNSEQYRMRQLMRGLNIDALPKPNRIHYAKRLPGVFPSIENDRYWKDARQQILDIDATLVFWDPLSSYHVRNENSNDQMRRVMDRFTYLNRECNCSTIVIHHFGKPDPNNPYQPLLYRMRGARAIQDWADTVMTITNPGIHSGNHSEPRRRFDFVKVRNGPIHEPIIVRRDKTFVHMQVPEKEDQILEVQEIVKEYGHSIGSQRKMVQRIESQLNIAYKTAFYRLKAALDGGYVTPARIDGTDSYMVPE